MIPLLESEERDQKIELYEKTHPEAARWAAGQGVIRHSMTTRGRVFNMVDQVAHEPERKGEVFEILSAADQIANAAIWLVVHQAYALRIYADGRDLKAEEFREKPQCYTGGALNLVPAFVAYHAINAITGLTRAWLVGQGHWAPAVDAVNLLLDNMSPAQAARYSLTDEGLARFVTDFCSARLNAQGEPDSPLGSHVNAYTAGALGGGGWLGLAELQYVHMPLPGERLVVFLSDAAFEEQRGSDWASRWWRAEDSGFVCPILIHNSHRIDQRTSMSLRGGIEWLTQHLELNGFDPIAFDGRDPAAFAWAIYRMERHLQTAREVIKRGEGRYPVSLPYGIAVAPRGAGFFGNSQAKGAPFPPEANPRHDPEAATLFNEATARLWLPFHELRDACRHFQNHESSGRAKEREHPLAARQVRLQNAVSPDCHPVPAHRDDRSLWTRSSPMEAVDAGFLAVVRANPHLRPRLGLPEPPGCGRMLRTIETLKFRVTDTEPGIPESVHGAVIAALNEEAVAAAALANKGGVNLIVTPEAFASRMYGVFRQEIIFAQECAEAGRPQSWISLPLILTSHAWEDGTNDLSHQDTAMSELMMNLPFDVSRVFFAADYNTTAVLLQSTYQTQGQFWTVVVPQSAGIADLFSEEESRQLLEQGAIRLDWAGAKPDRASVVLTAVGAFQLEEVLKASRRLAERKLFHSVVYMIEPGRFRSPRSQGERQHAAPEELVSELFPAAVPSRLFVTHTRPEPLLGALHRLGGAHPMAALGFRNRGSTLDTGGLLFVNQCTWGHILLETASLLRKRPEDLLSARELEALSGQRPPHGTIICGASPAPGDQRDSTATRTA